MTQVEWPRRGNALIAVEARALTRSFVIPSESLALSEVEWVEESLIINSKRCLD
jgi:hypothetical protein